MADAATSPSSLTPPPHVYSHVPLRSQSPQETGPSEYDQPRRPILRKPLSTISVVPPDGTMVQHTPSASVMVHPPADQGFPEASSVTIENDGPHLSYPATIHASDVHRSPQQPNDFSVPRRSLSPQITPIRHLLDDGSQTGPHRRNRSDNPQIQPQKQGLSAASKAIRHVSTSGIDPSSQVENFQPLQYHHQAFGDGEMRALDKRTSKLTIATTNSDGSSSSDPYARHEHLAPALPNSVYGNALQRPDSGFSSTSDLRGRTRSPHLSPAPNTHARANSAHSRSPDMRPLSYVDLLNVPYPQPPPSGAELLHNAQLRNSVGTNASLLSTAKTLAMYRANVRKTNDPAIQYEFAVFLISAAQEVVLDDELSASGFSEKSHDKSQGSIQGDLLKEARVILQRLSDRSYPFAQYYLADGYASGLFNKGKEDYDKAFPLFLSASKHGHAEAGYRTALCYEFGWGCRVDAAKAVQFYQHAASKNHPGAMLRLGKACLSGDMGLAKRYREGIRWLKRGAESADYQYNAAPYELGILHETGFGADVFRDEGYAAQLFTKSADLGHAEAAYRLGDAYEHGRLNCPQDPALSVHFYTGAAQQGHPLAQMALCAWYMVGIEPVLEKDENEAYEWARRAAESGLAKAQYAVGYFTEMGIGCRKDPLEANVWYVRAADQGDDRAIHRLAAIRDAAAGADPGTAAKGKKGTLTTSHGTGNVGPDGDKTKKRFVIF